MKTLEERFWEKVDKRGPEDCWEWKAYISQHGYGQFGIGKRRLYFAHRIAYQLSFGQIPEGMRVCHKCDNRSCCNPSHLFLGTQKDNINDGIRKGRVLIGEKNGGAKLTRDDVHIIRHLYSDGVNITKISKIFGVARQTISHIICGDTWKWLKEVSDEKPTDS